MWLPTWITALYKWTLNTTYPAMRRLWPRSPTRNEHWRRWRWPRVHDRTRMRTPSRGWTSRTARHGHTDVRSPRRSVTWSQTARFSWRPSCPARVGKPQQTSRGFRLRGKEDTADRDCSQVQQGRHGCVTFTARTSKCEELREAFLETRSPVLANCFSVEMKSLIYCPLFLYQTHSQPAALLRRHAHRHPFVCWWRWVHSCVQTVRVVHTARAAITKWDATRR